MSEYQKETAFLRQCLFHVECAECDELAERISEIQRDANCVRRAVWLMVVITMLALVSLGYAAVLAEYLPDVFSSGLVLNIICAAGVGSLIALICFMNLGMVYRRKLNQRREHCRQLISRFMGFPSDRSVTTPSRELRDHCVGEGEAGTVRGADAASAGSVAPDGTPRPEAMPANGDRAFFYLQTTRGITSGRCEG